MPATSLQIKPDGLLHRPHVQMGKLSPGGDRTCPMWSWDLGQGTESLTGAVCCPVGQLAVGPKPRRSWEDGLARAPSR